LFLLRGHNRVGLWGGFLMLAAIAITLPVRYTPSRYNYLPLVGFWMMAIAVFTQVFQWVAARVPISKRTRVLVVTVAIGAACAYHAIMLYWEFYDYRRVGDANKMVVDMYRTIQDRIISSEPIIFVNNGTRRPLTEIENSLRGYLKILYRRPGEIWELIRFEPLANFAGTPFVARTVQIPAEKLAAVFQTTFQVIEFTDQGFRLAEQYEPALREFYTTHKALPPGVTAYRTTPAAELE
jgi:hypothetical protein